ncbi:MAG: hypothetical protein IJ501_06660 [Bacilli bacterium]|nr:hypothetical protein [Bacilli bacterium]
MSEEGIIKILITDGSISYEIKLHNWSVNSNTREYLIEKATEYINEIFERGKDE